MAPGIRSLTAAVSLTAALLLTPPPHAAAVGDPTSSPSASPSAGASPSVSPSATSPSPRASFDDQHLAGSRAGVGRTRPGRIDAQYPSVADASDPLTPALDETPPRPPARIPAPDTARPSPPPAPTPTAAPARPRLPRRQSPQALSTDSDLRFHVLSLGAGLALTGLGLGFLALRLRRP
ncbi:hypothetical protein ACFYM2_02630 [Streptomyces sp. NPDC006711]|uniref:hypothetical protein n=1 Tax=unclassified Streptomyces TaxID=2593676 RepID=UPI0033D72653